MKAFLFIQSLQFHSRNLIPSHSFTKTINSFKSDSKIYLAGIKFVYFVNSGNILRALGKQISSEQLHLNSQTQITSLQSFAPSFSQVHNLSIQPSVQLVIDQDEEVNTQPHDNRNAIIYSHVSSQTSAVAVSPQLQLYPSPVSALSLEEEIEKLMAKSPEELKTLIYSAQANPLFRKFVDYVGTQLD